MRRLRAERVVDRPPNEVMQLFDGPVGGWLPVIVGPDEDTWRAETREGPVHVHVTVHAGDVWVLPDGSHRREFAVQPDRSDWHDLLAAGLTPRLEGELRVVSDDDDVATRLVFEGRTRRRSRLTISLERAVVGDPLVRSGLHALLDVIAERLRAAPLEPSAPGPRHGVGPIRIAVPRRA